MRKTVALAAAGSLIAIGGAAWAQQDIELGEWKVNVHAQGVVIGPSFDFNLEPEEIRIVGFRLDFDFVNQFDDSSWAADLEFKLTDPGATTFVVGQLLDNPFGPPDEPWDFDRPASQASGHYRSDHFPDAWQGGIDIGGTWNVMLAETWDGGVEYNNITLRLIPAPGALAFLGVAGLLGAPGVAGLLGAPRRRRR